MLFEVPVRRVQREDAPDAAPQVAVPPIHSLPRAVPGVTKGCFGVLKLKDRDLKVK